MWRPHRVHEILFSLISFVISISLAQSDQTQSQSINQQSVFSSQKPCAQSCFEYNNLGCSTDALGGALGCQAPFCSNQFAATNNCYCRTDLQSVATSYLSSCVNKGCTVGDSSIDISSAISIYGSYCSANGFVVDANAPAATTQATEPNKSGS